MYLRKTDIKDLEHLSKLIYDSEKSLNFNENYMSAFKDKYNVNKEFIQNNPSFCIIESDKIIGFFGLSKNKDKHELEFFYVDSEYIGKGYGKIMFGFLISECKTLGIKEFNFVTSPQSLEFYTKLGAIKIGETKSLVDESRVIPILKFIID